MHALAARMQAREDVRAMLQDMSTKLEAQMEVRAYGPEGLGAGREASKEAAPCLFLKGRSCVGETGLQPWRSLCRQVGRSADLHGSSKQMC